MKKEKTTNFPIWRFVLGTLIGGTLVFGGLLFVFMQRGINATFNLFLFSYIGICLICGLPMMIADMKNIQKKETVYWLSFLGVMLPFGPILWLIGLLISIISKRKTQKLCKKNLLLFYGCMFFIVLIEFFIGVSIRKTYENSFILPKWEDRFELNEEEKKCHFMATLGLNQTRHQQDIEYRKCLKQTKENKERAISQEKKRITNLSKKAQTKEVFDLCVNILKQDIKNYKVSKYDTVAQEKLRNNVNYINKISKELCQCASNLFVEKASDDEIINLLVIYKPTSPKDLFFWNHDMPFQICLKQKYNFETQYKINRALHISFF
ncbi:MAG: hypothetical protein J6W27_00590 [Alphaproteobacteria bacterium]|nr:hypothetical protein [Alphaproteobacteria bacterium]